MKRFVVAIYDFDDSLSQYEVFEEDKLKAVNSAMRALYSDRSSYLKDEIKWQESERYPKTFEDLEKQFYLSDRLIKVTEIL